MDQNEEMRVIETIAKRIAAFSSVRRIILFGSRAEGRARLDSDFDICVVTIDGAAGESAYIEMMSTIISSRYSIDLELCDETEFARRTAEGWSVFRAIRDRGKELYAAS